MNKKQNHTELKPWPELRFLDPITGECPKNVKELIAKEAESSKPNTTIDILQYKKAYDFVTHVLENRKTPDTATGKSPLPRSVEFKISNLKSHEPSPSSLGYSDSQIMNNYKKKTIRKALFKNDGRPSLRKSTNFKRGIPKIQKPQKNKVDETLPLLDIEETEHILLNPMLNLKPPDRNTFQKPTATITTVLSKKPKLEKISSESSLEEFLQFEQQCKTPKSQKKISAPKKIDVSIYLKNIVAKVNENERLYQEMGKNMSDIKHNLNLILSHQNMTESKSVANGENMISFQDTENIAPIKKETPTRSAKGKNLRITTLQKTIEKKVLFDLQESPSDNIKSSRTILKTTSIHTPNTMCRIVKKKAEEQFLKLRDTPKVRR